MRENSPANEEDEVVHGGKAQILAAPELQDIRELELALSFVQTEELIGAKEGWKSCESLHDDVAAHYNGENDLLEEAFDHPGIYRLGAHQELCGDT